MRTPEDVMARRPNAHDALDIRIEEAQADRVVLSMPVTWKVHQPFGVLHGGVSVLLAESAASIGATINCPPGSHAVGIEINGSHLRPVADGDIRATATPVRVGRRIQVWDIEVIDGAGRLVNRSRCTLAVVEGE